MATNPDRDPVEVEADALADKVEIVKAVKVGRPIHAEEWAVRRGSMIAEKHLPNGSFEEKDALCAEVAEELSATRANMERTCDDLREMIRTAQVAERERDAALASLAEKERRIGELDSAFRGVRQWLIGVKDEEWNVPGLDEIIDGIDRALTPDAGEG